MSLNYHQNALSKLSSVNDHKLEQQTSEEPQQQLFVTSARKHQSTDQTLQDNDLIVDTLSDDDFDTNHKSTESSRNLIRKPTSQSYPAQISVPQTEKHLIAEYKRDQHQFRQPQYQEDNDSSSSFSDVNDILDTHTESKVYQSTLPKQENNIIEFDEATKQKYSQYMSWQSQEQSTNKENNDANGIIQVHDPYCVEAKTDRLKGNDFVYNEHGVHSQESEDEEATEMPIYIK